MKLLSGFRRARHRLPVLAFVALVQVSNAAPALEFHWSTFAGRASIGLEDGNRLDARFNQPGGIGADLKGNLYVADAGNHAIRKILPDGTVVTFAGTSALPGSADGLGAAARFNHPTGLAVDSAGNVYVADTGNHTIRKITPAGVVSTLAGQAGQKGIVNGPAATALFDTPGRLTVDPQGNVYLYNGGVRKISAGQVQTLPIPKQVVDPWGTAITIKTERGPAVDSSGQLYFATSYTGEFLRVNTDGSTTVFRDSLSGTDPDPSSVTAIHYSDDVIFNGPSGNLFLEMVMSKVDTVVERRAVSMHLDGTLDLNRAEALIDGRGQPLAPGGLTIDQSGNWFYTLTNEDAIRSQGMLFAGTGMPAESSDGQGNNARLRDAELLAFDPFGNLWLAEAPETFRKDQTWPGYVSEVKLRKISPGRIVYTPNQSWPANSDPRVSHFPVGLVSDPAGNVYLTRANNNPELGSEVFKMTPTETISSLSSSSPLFGAKDLALSASGNLLTFYLTGKYDISSVFSERTSDGQWTVIAGSQFWHQDGTGTGAAFWSPFTLVSDGQGNFYFLDANFGPPEFYIRKITSTGNVTTVSPHFDGLAGGLAVDSKGNLYVSFMDRNVIARLEKTGELTIIGGVEGVTGSRNGTGAGALFASPGRIAIDAQDNLYVVDGIGTTIRRGTTAGTGPSIVTQPQSQTVEAGGAVQFSITASGDPAPTYQWYLNNNPFADAKGATLSFSNARSSDAGDYTVVVTNSLGTVTSSKATLTVTTSTPTPPAQDGGANNNRSGGGTMNAGFVTLLLAMGVVRISRNRCG